VGIILYLGRNPNASSHKGLCFDTPFGPMNPASVKFHTEILIKCGIMEKQRGFYSLTDLGKTSHKILECLLKREYHNF